MPNPMPNTPKIALRRYLANAKDAASTPVTVTAGPAVTVSTSVAAPQPSDALEDWLVAGDPAVTTVTIPAHYTGQAVALTGSANAGGIVHVIVEAGATVALEERWRTSGEHLGIWVVLDVADNATVNWLTYDAMTSTTALVKRTANLAAHTTLNWTTAGFTQASGATLIAANLIGTGAKATVNVGVLAAGKQHVGYVTAMTNDGRQTVGHINQRGVITGHAHLIFNGIGHIIHGARGSDNQQENRVLMLSPHARGDANPILLIDENDVTAGHAASVTRVDERQLYYLMSRGLREDTAKRLVIRGFLEAGLADITDPALKAELFQTIDETLVNADA